MAEWFESLNLNDLMESYGSPNYILSKAQLEKNYYDFKEFLSEVGYYFTPLNRILLCLF